MNSRNSRAGLALVLALLFGLLLAGGEAWAAPPPTLEVQTIGYGIVTASGIQCGATHLACAAAYTSDPSSVAIKATPRAGWTFVRWDDDASGPCGVSPTCTLPVTGDMYATAVFTTTSAVQLATLTTSVNEDTSQTPSVPEGTVTDLSSDSSINCPATNCSAQVIAGSTLTVKEDAASASGYLFNQWVGNCTGAHEWCSVYLPANRTVSAEFATSATTTLTVTVAGGGTVSGAGMTCAAGSTCTAQEPSNGTFTLTATADSGYTFSAWGGACAGNQTTCTVDTSADRAVTATFVKVVPLLLTVNGAGTVSDGDLTCGPGPATCSGSAAPGSTIQFQAKPTAAGGTVTWSGCTSAAGLDCNVIVGSSPISITTTFSGGTTGGGSFVNLTVTVTGDGYVTATSGAAIYCTAAGGSGCSASVQQNAIVSLHASSAAGNSFSPGWGGSCIGTSTTCTLTMSTPKSATADFTGANTTYDLTASVAGSGAVSGAGLNCRVTGSTSCASPQAADASVTINAVPSAGYAFAGWSGACSGTSPTCSIAMSSDQSVSATFKSTASPTARLSLSVAGHGSVTGLTTPCVGTTATKPTACSQSVKTGSTVSLKAVPAKGYVFAGWSGNCTGTKPTCSVVMSTDAEVLATFKPAPLAAGAKKPKVTKIAAGYRITLSFRVGEAGRLTVTTKPKTVTTRKTMKAGAATLRLTVKKHARYVITLSLKSKSGTHKLHYTVKV